MKGYLIWTRLPTPKGEKKETRNQWLRRGCRRFENKWGEKPNHIIADREGIGLPDMTSTVMDIVPKHTAYIGVKDGRLYQESRLEEVVE